MGKNRELLIAMLTMSFMAGCGAAGALDRGGDLVDGGISGDSRAPGADPGTVPDADPGAAPDADPGAAPGSGGGTEPLPPSPSSDIPPAPWGHPRQQWIRDATIGLSLHWGMRTSPASTDVAAWEAKVTGDGWKAEYWVSEAEKLHAQYLILASFHSKLGYVRTWPSKIPGSPATKRDFLGELIAAAKVRGLKVLLYITDDPSHHNESGFEYLDRAAYAKYVGDESVDILTREGFGRFSYDNFIEILQRYPELAGFWIDNDNEYWDQHGLYDRIRKERPSWLLSNNNEDTSGFDYVSNEEKIGMTPPFDYPAATWTAQPRLSEGNFKTAGGWWYGGGNPTVDYTMNIGRILTCAGSSIKAVASEGAMVGGRFPPNVEAFNNFLEGFLGRIWESIGGTEGGGYRFGGFQPGELNAGAFAVTTVSRANPDLHYLHVLQRGSAGNNLRVRDNAYRVAEVVELRTGAKLGFSQGAGTLTIEGISQWDPYDTVFRIKTSGRVGVYPKASLQVTATVSRAGFPASNLLDDNFTTYWDNNGQLPASLHLDLGARKPIVSLAIHQREWSESDGSMGSANSARIKAYAVYLSDDGQSFGQPVKTGTLPSARGVRFIDVGPQAARYIRLEVSSTWATASKYASKLLIDELSVIGDFVRQP